MSVTRNTHNRMEVQSCCSETFKNGGIDKLNVKIPIDLQNSVESIAKKEGFLTYSVASNEISTNGGNYLAELYTIDIKGKTNYGDKEINLFVKNVIPTGAVSGFISNSEVFSRESFVYKELSKIFTQIEDEANIPVEERYKMVKGYEESSSESIIMENVTKKGFKTCGRKEIPSLKYVELSIEQLAKLHGLGFAIQKFKPQYFEHTLIQMKNPFKFNDEWSKFMNKVASVSITSIRDELKEKVERFSLDITKKFVQYFHDINVVQTLCHGDFRALNIMMKEEEGEVVEIIPVDLQLFHYGCPVNDVLYFIAGCTDRQFRKKHYDYLMDFYYESLKNYLKYFDMDVTDVYPRSKFDAALRDRAYFGLTIALAYFPFILANEDDYPDLNNTELSINIDPYAVNRIEEVIEELDDLGLL